MPSGKRKNNQRMLVIFESNLSLEFKEIVEYLGCLSSCDARIRTEEELSVYGLSTHDTELIGPDNVWKHPSGKVTVREGEFFIGTQAFLRYQEQYFQCLSSCDTRIRTEQKLSVYGLS